MSMFDLMNSKVPEYTKTDFVVYEYVKKWPDLFAEESISTIVGTLNISQSALTRFAKKLGYSGFQEFQYAFKAERSSGEQEKEGSRSAVYSEYLKRVEDALNQNDLNEISERIVKDRVTYFTGFSLSRLPAEYMKTSFDLLGKPAILTLTESWSLAPGKNDVLILYSVASGAAYTERMRRMEGQDNTPYKVLVTMYKKHPLRKYFDKVIVLPGVPAGSASDQVLPETFGFLMFNDLLLKEIGKYSHTENMDGKEI